MPTPAPRREPESPPGTGMAAAGIGAAVLMIACCAALPLLVAGALAGIGVWLASPWVIAAAALLLVAAVTAVVRRRRSGRDVGCPPTSSTMVSAERDRLRDPADKEGPYHR